MKIKDSKDILSFFKYLKPYWKKETVVLILNFAIAGLSLVYPYLAKQLIDKAYAEKNLVFFIQILCLGGLIFIVSSLFHIITGYLREYIDLRVKFDLQKVIFQKIENLPFGYFLKKPTGEYIYRTMVEVYQVSDFITSFGPELFSIFPKFLLVFAILLYINWKISIVTFIIALLLYIPSFFISRKIRMQSEKMLESSQNVLEKVRETFSNMQLVKVFAKETKESRRFVNQMIKNIRLSLVSSRLNLFGSFLGNWANRLLFGLIIFYGGYNIIKGRITLGSFTAIMLYINQLLDLSGMLVSFFTQHLVIGTVSVRRFSEILKSWPREQEMEDEYAREFLISSGQIEFKDVTFGYYPDMPVLEHLSFNIKGGLAIGLVGNSGRGKTTIVHLMVKLYQIQKGKILIDERDINLIKSHSLREQIGMVLQKPILWNDTVRNNIIYARPKATQDEIIRASKISYTHDFIKDLPQGYDTIIGEAGVSLSEGQKQRIALARAVIKNPKILIIDEGMSSLDSYTEDSIIDNIKCELKDITLIIVSHRLSTIKNMDIVYFLETKDKISIGHHEELLTQNHRYKELFASQIEKDQLEIRI